MSAFTKFFFLFFIGLGIGFALFFTIGYLPLSASNPVLSQLGIHKPRIVGFLPYFLLDRATNNYNLEITTLSYFGLTIDTDGHIVMLSSPQQEDPAWHDLRSDALQNKLKNAKNHHIDLSLTVVLEDEDKITQLLSNPQKHAENLLSDIIPQMKKYGFTDLNIDIESFQKADSQKQQAFTTFLQVVKNGVEKEKIGTVTVDIAPIAFIRSFATNPIKIGRIADYVMIMAYDFHSVTSSNTGAIAPLGGGGRETEYDVSQVVAIAKKEIDPKKIILGVPSYGYEWDSLTNSPHAATIPNTGQTASNRRVTSIFTSSCQTCVIEKDTLAAESDFIYQEKKGDSYFHHTFLLNTSDLEDRILFANNQHLAGIGIWALGYEGDTLLQPLALYKTNFTLQ